VTKVTRWGYSVLGWENSNARQQFCIYSPLVSSMEVLPEQIGLSMHELSPDLIIVLYDGICGLCNRLNQFLLRRDRGDRFRFASLQSQFASRVLARHGINPDNLDTVYVLLAYEQPGESLLARGDAVSYVLRELDRAWGVFAAIFGILPKAARNKLYDVVAANRYRLFGQHEVCAMPDPKYRQKFIEI
jgi:predicted DCC family thiol-disulfide oxidoreductase YuxK